ncbi:hypothetical protein [Pantoea sp. B65]|uniref:hypothetical protein n=1 Tax=Pantoea sp. B65 TaxID=2813359 RepID=UPI0039B39E5F
MLRYLRVTRHRHEEFAWQTKFYAAWQQYKCSARAAEYLNPAVGEPLMAPARWRQQYKPLIRKEYLNPCCRGAINGSRPDGGSNANH